MKKKFLEIFTPSASKNVLLIFAGIVWMAASFILIFKGILFFLTDTSNYLIKLFIAIIIFIFFFKLLFKKVSVKYLKRIISLKKEKPCIFSFFSIKGYTLMIFMMGMGIGLRDTKIIPLSYLSCLYFGVGIPLLASSFRFYISGFNYSRLKN